MDNTPIYIKMADCPEIQGVKPVEPEGFIYNPNWNKHEFYFYKDSEKASTIREIWLPRQDDLQKMVIAKVCADYTKTDLSPEHRLVTVFASFVTAVRFPYKIPQNDLTSMEQLWLAFVMSELHSKTWDGEAWVSE